MYQIDVASAASALPTPAAAGTPGFFTEGDPVSGQAATVVPADFLNMLMLELLGVVVAAGATPSKTDHTQLLAAIRAVVAGGNLAATGHVTVAVGSLALTINWGGGTHVDNTGAMTVVFDQAFSSTFLRGFATNAAGGPPSAFHGTGGGTKTGMTVYSASAATTAAAAGTSFNYIAIGI